MQPKLRFKGCSNKWRERRLSQVTKITMGQSPLSKNYTNNPNDKLLIQGNADLANGKIAPRLYTKQITKISHKGDTILTVRAPVGAVAVNNYGIAVIGRGVANIAHNDFTRYWLEYFQNAKGWLRYSTGSTFNSVNSKIIKALPLMVPNLSEQRLIGRFFARLDKLISLQQSKLDLLKKQKRGYLQKLFPQKNEFAPRVRFNGFTSLWHSMKLKDMLSKVIDNRGKTPPHTRDKTNHPVLEVASLGQYNPNYSTVKKYVTDNTFKKWFRNYLNNGDILFSTVGDTGLTSMVNDKNSIVAQNIIGLRFNSSMDSNFTLAMFGNYENFKKARRIQMGAIQPSIKVTQLIKISYLVPSLSEQHLIGRFFKRLDDNINLQNDKLYYLRKLKKAYLQKMFC